MLGSMSPALNIGSANAKNSGRLNAPGLHLSAAKNKNDSAGRSLQH